MWTRVLLLSLILGRGYTPRDCPVFRALRRELWSSLFRLLPRAPICDVYFFSPILRLSISPPFLSSYGQILLDPKRAFFRRPPSEADGPASAARQMAGSMFAVGMKLNAGGDSLQRALGSPAQNIHAASMRGYLQLVADGCTRREAPVRCGIRAAMHSEPERKRCSYARSLAQSL